MQVRTRDANGQAGALRLESAPALLVVVYRAAMIGVVITQSGHPNGGGLVGEPRRHLDHESHSEVR